MNGRPQLLVLLILAAGCAGRDDSGPLTAVRDAEVARDAAAPALSAALRDAGPRVRARAALALGRIQAPGAASLLAPLAEDAVPEVAAGAIFALGQLGLAKGARADAMAVETCSRHAAAGDPVLAALAVECLGKQAPADGAGRLEAAFDHADARVRTEAAHAAMRMRFVPVWRGESKEPPPFADSILPRLTAALADGDVEVRRAAAHALSRYGERRAGEALARAAADADPWVRLHAVRALGRSGDTAWTAALARACADGDPGVRFEAAAALDALGAADEIPAALAADPSPHVRARLAASLRERKRADRDALLLSLLADPSPTVAGAALGACAALPPERARAEIEAWLGDPRWPVRAAAARAAGALGAVGLPVLARVARDGDARVRAAAVAATEGLEAAPAARALIEQGLGGATIAERGEAVARIAASSWSDRVDLLARAYRDAEGPDGIEIRDTIRGAVSGDARALEALGAERASERTPPPFDAWAEVEAPEVEIETDRGALRIRLFPDAAPYHVATFVGLVRRGFYDGLPWHRVVPDFVVQGGDPEGTGWGGPGFTLPDEISRVRFGRGTVGMPKAGKDTGGGQIFVTHLPTPHLDGNYTVFGEVVSGVDVIDRIEVGDLIRSARTRE